MPTNTPYRRVPGSGWGANSLWYGPDHLLSVQYKIFSQDYKRFYYQDIQAVITCEHAYFRLINAILVIISGFFVLLAVFLGEVGAAVSGTMGVVFFLGFLAYLAWGPNCVCYLKTAVQIEKLSPLSRRAKVRKAMDFLGPVIEEVQGKLLLETLQENMTASSGVAPRTPRYNHQPHPQTISHEPGHWHKALFGLLVFMGVYYMIIINYRHIALITIEGFLSFGLGALVIVALVKQHNSDMTKGVRNVTWVTLGYVCFEFLAGTILYIVVVIKNVNNTEFIGDQFAMMRIVSDISPFENPLLLGMYVFSIVCTFGLGISGTLTLRDFQASVK